MDKCSLFSSIQKNRLHRQIILKPTQALISTCQAAVAGQTGDFAFGLRPPLPPHLITDTAPQSPRADTFSTKQGDFSCCYRLMEAPFICNSYFLFCKPSKDSLSHRGRKKFGNFLFILFFFHFRPPLNFYR